MALSVCLEGHINRKDCRRKVTLKAGRGELADNVQYADMTRRSGKYLLEEKESPFSLQRIVMFPVSVFALNLLLLRMRPHPGMTATRERKSHHWFGW